MIVLQQIHLKQHCAAGGGWTGTGTEVILIAQFSSSPVSTLHLNMLLQMLVLIYLFINQEF